MNILFLSFSILFVFLAGLCDGWQTCIKDLPREKTITGAWIIRKYGTSSKWWEWYNGIGGNARWNPSYPSIPFIGIWLADGWHTGKFGWVYSYAIAIGFASMANLNLWQAALFCLLAQAVEGTSFRWWYGYGFRTEPIGTFWTFIKASFNLFGNNHKISG